jgi:hypothetical protein
VAVHALRVLLSKDDDGWFAQGLEIDYASSGESLDEVKANFAHGLLLTVHEHLRMHGSIERLFKPGPSDSWAEYLTAQSKDDCVKQKYSTIQFHDVSEHKALASEVSGRPVRFPFDTIHFIGREPEALAA